METLTIERKEKNKTSISNNHPKNEYAMFCDEEETILTPYGMKRIDECLKSGFAPLDELKKKLNYDSYSFA